MKKATYLLMIIALFSVQSVQAQLLKNIKDKVAKEVGTDGNNLSEDEVGKGLKEALTIGIKKGVETVSKPDGYFKDPVIKILMPEEARQVEEKLRAIGQDKLVDDAIEAMNRAAEDAATEAVDLFVGAIKNLSIQDAMNILGGPNDAATQYLKAETTVALTDKFRPIIGTSLEKVNATRYWNSLFSTYNKIPFVKKVNPDLEAYVTERAIQGLFVQLAKEEKEIRTNPAARVTDLLKKVFN